MAHDKTMEAAKVLEDVDTMATSPVIAVKEDAGHKPMGIGAKVVVV